MSTDSMALSGDRARSSSTASNITLALLVSTLPHLTRLLRWHFSQSISCITRQVQLPRFNTWSTSHRPPSGLMKTRRTLGLTCWTMLPVDTASSTTGASHSYFSSSLLCFSPSGQLERISCGFTYKSKALPAAMNPM